MERKANVAEIVRKIAVITLVGFLVVTLGGPALALAGTLLPFLLVGSAVYLAYRAVTLGPRIAFRTLSKGLRLTARAVTVVPFWIAGKTWGGVRHVGLAARTLGGIALEGIGGAIVGGGLGIIGGMQHHDVEWRVPMGALIGLGVGLVIALTHTRPARTPAAAPAAAPALDVQHV